MIKAAEEVILLVAHNKIGKVALAPIAPIEAVHKMVTDSKASQKDLQAFRERGVGIIIA